MQLLVKLKVQLSTHADMLFIKGITNLVREIRGVNCDTMRRAIVPR